MHVLDGKAPSSKRQQATLSFYLKNSLWTPSSIYFGLNYCVVYDQNQNDVTFMPTLATFKGVKQMGNSLITS